MVFQNPDKKTAPPTGKEKGLSVESILSNAFVTAKRKAIPQDKKKLIKAEATPYSPNASQFPKEYRNILKQIGDYCAHKIQVSLKQYLRINIEVFWANMESSIFSDFISHLPSYSCIHILQSSVFQHPSLIVQNIPTISALMERVLGARILDKPTVLEFTSVDIAIVSKITSMITAEIEKAFQSIVPVSWRIHRHETNPMLASVIPDKENIVTMSFEMKGPFPPGTIHLCLAASDLLGHLEKYKKNQMSSQNKQQNALMKEQMKKIPVEVSIRLGEITLEYNDLMNLCVGDILKMDQPLFSPVSVYVEETPKYIGKLGKSQEYWACLIEKTVGSKK
ncbi:MAG: FliM/FliN family flagellar motor switch protein [Candidatus Brocadiae bacterium]|nr:FliM/FliN family flagellar motor switch protein [Candidatus Brocadiia bacterium]